MSVSKAEREMLRALMAELLAAMDDLDDEEEVGGGDEAAGGSSTADPGDGGRQDAA